MMTESILKGKLDEIGEIPDYGWQYKKQMAEGITNPVINEIYETAKKQAQPMVKYSEQEAVVL